MLAAARKAGLVEARTLVSYRQRDWWLLCWLQEAVQLVCGRTDLSGFVLVCVVESQVRVQQVDTACQMSGKPWYSNAVHVSAMESPVQPLW